MPNKKWKILLISANPNNAIGGIATWTKGYLTYCKTKKIICDLVDTAKVSKYRYGIFNELFRTYNIIEKVKKKMDFQRPYDIVHFNSSIGFYGIIRDYLLARIIKRKKVNLVLHFHCDVQYWDQRKLIQFFLKKTINLADSCIVLCKSSEDYLLERYNKQSVIIPNYIDVDNIRESRMINKNVKTVVYTGRISEAKGSIELFQLAKRFPDITFLLIGRVLLNLNDFEVPFNVNLVGEKEHGEVLKLLGNSDVYLLPSHSEGFSIALTEAMANGLPSIVTDVGANQDMVSDGAGIVVQVGDIDRMELALKKMMDQEVRKIMSENALRKVKSQYVLDNVMEQIILLYQGLIKNENK